MNYRNYVVAGRKISDRVKIWWGDIKSSRMPTQGDNDKHIGWFRNNHNASGWTVCKMTGFDVQWMEETGFGDAIGGKNDINGIYRIFSDMGTSVAWFNFETGTVRFFDNETYENTDKPAFERGVKFTKFIFDIDPIAEWF